MSPSSVESLCALALGFAFAGLLATGYHVLMGRPLGLRQLEDGGVGAVASVPVLVFSAPFIIIRSLIRAHKVERRPMLSVMLATILACGWSLLCGRLVLDAAHLLGMA